MQRFARTLIIALLASLGAACGGVGSGPSNGTISPLPDPRIATATVKRVAAKLVIRIPRRRHHHRRAHFVSPSTQSIVIATQETAPVPGSVATSYANLTSGSPDCSGSGAPYTCTVTLSGLTSGATYSLTFVTYDATQSSAAGPYNGRVLSQNTVAKKIVAGVDNTIGIILDGVPASFAVVPAANTQPFDGNTTSGLYFGYINPQTWTINTLDADGNFIVGPGAPAVTASIDVGATGGIAVTPSATNPNKFTVSATGPGGGTLLLSAAIPGSSSPLSLGVGLTSGTLTTTVAGQVTTLPTCSSADGTGTQVVFCRPSGTAYNPSDGNVYIADAGNCTIRELNPSTLGVTTYVGTAGTCSYQNGTGSTAFFNAPQSVTADNAGNLFVGDNGNYAIRIVAPGGVVRLLTGDQGAGTSDGAVGTAQLSGPSAIAYDPDENDLYVTDGCTVRQVSLSGGSPGYVTTIAGVAGACDGTGSDFNSPAGIVYAGNHTLYVADTGNCEIRRITNLDSTPQPDTVAAPFAGSTTCGYVNGTGEAAEFTGPGFLAYDDAHKALYVVDDDTIRAMTLPAAVVTTIAGTAGQNVHFDGWQAAFRLPAGLTYDPASSTLYLSDRQAYVVEEVQL